ACRRAARRLTSDTDSYGTLLNVTVSTASSTLSSGRSGRFAVFGCTLYTDCQRMAAITSPDRDVTESHRTTTDRLSIRHSHWTERSRLEAVGEAADSRGFRVFARFRLSVRVTVHRTLQTRASGLLRRITATSSWMAGADKKGPTDAAQRRTPENRAGWSVPGIRLVNLGVRRACLSIGAGVHHGLLPRP